MELLPCPYATCDRSFTTTYNRKKHVEACHLKLRPYICPLCAKTFPYKHSLNYHLKLHERQDRAVRAEELAEATRALSTLLGKAEGRGWECGGKEGGIGICTGLITEKAARL